VETGFGHSTYAAACFTCRSPTIGTAIASLLMRRAYPRRPTVLPDCGGSPKVGCAAALGRRKALGRQKDGCQGGPASSLRPHVSEPELRERGGPPAPRSGKVGFIRRWRPSPCRGGRRAARGRPGRRRRGSSRHRRPAGDLLVDLLLDGRAVGTPGHHFAVPAPGEDRTGAAQVQAGDVRVRGEIAQRHVEQVGRRVIPGDLAERGGVPAGLHDRVLGVERRRSRVPATNTSGRARSRWSTGTRSRSSSLSEICRVSSLTLIPTDQTTASASALVPSESTAHPSPISVTVVARRRSTPSSSSAASISARGPGPSWSATTSDRSTSSTRPRAASTVDKPRADHHDGVILPVAQRCV
jgi:hypothetical protein